MENIYFVGPTTLTTIKLAGIEDVRRFMEETSEFCFDTEGTGLDPHTSEVIMIQIGNQHKQFVIDARYVDITELFPMLVSPERKKIGANIKYDYKMMLKQYGIRMQGLCDVMLREMILECGKQRFGFSLKALTKKYCNVELEKDVRGEFGLLHGAWFNERQIVYGGRDVIYPQLIYNKQLRKIVDERLGTVVNLEDKFLKVLAEMEFNGINVSPELWRELYVDNKRELIKATQALNDYLIDNNMYKFLGQLDLFTGKPTVSINWSSTKQVVPVFKALGIPTQILDKEKTVEVKDRYGLDIDMFKDSVGKAEVSKYEKDYPFVALYLRFKKYGKAISTYGEKWLTDNVNPVTGRVHSDFWQILNTGRISSSNPNIQQIPSYKSKDRPKCEAHRTCFLAPRGRKLIVRDYSGCELRILAEYSNENSMREEFISGLGDLHSVTASKVYSTIQNKFVPVSETENKHLRHTGKTLNFALSYGAGAFKIAKSLGIEADEGQKIVDSFYQAFPKLKQYFANWHEFVKQNGYVLIDDYTGRKSYFPFYEEYNDKLKQIDEYRSAKYEAEVLGLEVPPFPKSIFRDIMVMRGTMERAAQNYRIQGTNASMTKIAMVMLYNWILEKNYFDKVSIVLSLHDEIVIEADDDVALEVDKKLQEVMLYSGKLFCPNVPMKTDGGVCSVWEH